MDSKSTSNGQLDFGQLYTLGSDLNRGALHFRPVHDIDNPASLLRGDVRPRHLVEFRRYMGTKPQDIMGTTHAILLLVSERFVDVLLEERATGWGTYPVRIYDKIGLELSGYHGLTVTGRAGPIDRSRSRIELVPPPVPQGKAMYTEIGTYFDPATWDGSDIFVLEGTGVVCVVERIKLALEKRELTNLDFERMSERHGNISSKPPSERARDP